MNTEVSIHCGAFLHSLDTLSTMILNFDDCIRFLGTQNTLRAHVLLFLVLKYS